MLVILLAMLVSFLVEKIPTELTGMGAFSLLLVIGFLEPEQALGVFSNPGPVAVGAMFILSAALDKCGAIDSMAGALDGLPKLRLPAVLCVMTVLVGFISAFINNTPVVIVFLPVVLSLARRLKISASKLLIPLSYAAIFGGSCTLVGTSTNIIVSSVAEEHGYAPFGMFELAAVGIPLMVFGTAYLCLFGHRLLPDREAASAALTEGHGREYILEAYIRDRSPMDGKMLAETSLGKLEMLRVIEILRRGVRLRGAPNEMRLQAGDRLLIAVAPPAVANAQNVKGLDLRDTLGDGLEQISLSRGVVVEAVVAPDSRLAGQALGDMNFRQSYRMAPLAVYRQGCNYRSDFERIPLAPGDTLLLLGTAEAIEANNARGDLLFLNKPPVIMAARRKKIPLIGAVIAGVIVTAATGLLPVAAAAIVGSVVLLLTQCLTTKEAYGAIHWPILFLIFAMLGVGAAMESTGTSKWMAEKVVHTIDAVTPEAWKPLALLATIYLITTALTEVLSNNSAAILISSLAIGIAESAGLDPRPFLVAIAMAASASFATPIGYQTNTYVYGIGGYRFTDFLKVGVPLNILAFIVSMIVIPLIWKF